MELWLWAVIGGLAGTVLMDVTAIAAEKLNITSGGRCGGPQVIYLTGGGLALTYPLFYVALSSPLPPDHLIPSVVWGLATTLLPWLILYPGYGWGLFGLRAPKNASPLIATPVAHMLYGLGLGIVLNLAV